MNKYGWLAVTFVGTVISSYGNKKIRESVASEQRAKLV